MLKRSLAMRRWLPATPPRVMFAGLVAIALIPRLAYIGIAEWLGVESSFFASDSELYSSAARSLLDGAGFSLNGVPTAHVGPGYPTFLALVYALGGFSVAAIGIAQAIVGSVTVGLIGLIASRLSNAVAGWAGGLLAAGYPHLIFWTGHVLSETLFVFLAVLALWLLIEAHARQAGWGFLAAGIALGLGALTRSILLAVVPLLLLAAWHLASSGKRQRWIAPAALALGVALVVGPWTARNALVLGVASPLETKAALVLWQGHNPGESRGSGGYVHPADTPRIGIPWNVPPEERASAAQQAALSYVVSDPWSVVVHMPAKFWNMWRPVYADASIRNWLVNGTSYLLLVTLALMGLWMTARPTGRASGARYVQAFVVSLLLAHLLITGMIRFRLPIEAALCILAGVAMGGLVGYLRRGVAEASASRDAQPPADGALATAM